MSGSAGYAIDCARAEDIPEMIAIERVSSGAAHWAEADYETIFSSPESGRVVTTRIAFVVRMIGQEDEPWMAGFIVGRMLQLADGSEAEVENLAVRSGLRGRGIGRALVERLAEWCSAEGGESLRLEVRASNAIAAHLYERAGFQLLGRRRRYYPVPGRDEGEDALLFERRL